jgi:hypothetical protein
MSTKNPLSASPSVAYPASLTHPRRRLVPQDRLDLLEHLRRQLRDDLDRFEVVEQLVDVRRAEDHRRRVRVPRDPGQRKVADLAAEFWASRSSE